MVKRGPSGRPQNQKKKPGLAKTKKVGQAPALSARDWHRWIKFVLENHTTMMAILLEFTGLFALRCGEACALKTSDLLLRANPPQLRIRNTQGAGKSPGNVPITDEKVAYIERLRDEGASWKRTRCNRHKSWTVTDKYTLPTDGPLFPSNKKKRKAKKEPITYHAVWSAVNKLAKAFAKKYPGNDFEKIRSHTGRASAITTMMGQGVSLPMSMKFARHKPGSLRVHLTYGQLTCMDVYRAVSNATPSQAVGPVMHQSGHALAGTTLKNLVEWHDQAKLSDKEFQVVKDKMLSTL